MFYSVSNHQCVNWSEKQLLLAGGINNIVELGFPPINGDSSEQQIAVYVQDYLKKIPNNLENTVFVNGEYCFVYALIKELKKRGQKVVCSNAEIKLQHKKDDFGNSIKKIDYKFLNYKEYEEYPKEINIIKNKNNVLLNCSINYSIKDWDDNAMHASKKIGIPQDYMISVLNSANKEKNVKKVEKYLEEIDEIAPNGIILDGHFYTFYMMAEVLMRKGYDIYVKSSDRNTIERKTSNECTEKISMYKFKRFRKIFEL